MPKGTVSQLVIENDLSADRKNQVLRQYVSAVNEAQLSYNPFESNSNSFAYGALGYAGLPRPEPVVWAPAWDTRLPIPSGP